MLHNPWQIALFTNANHGPGKIYIIGPHEPYQNTVVVGTDFVVIHLLATDEFIYKTGGKEHFFVLKLNLGKGLDFLSRKIRLQHPENIQLVRITDNSGKKQMPLGRRCGYILLVMIANGKKKNIPVLIR